jgi:hypothetical protein
VATSRGKSDRQALAEHAPWKPAPFDPADAAAFQALSRGNATPDQQKRALDWLVKKACRTYDLSYRPGEDGRRDTDFAEGQRSIGLQVVKLLNIKIGLLTGKGEGT